MVEIRQVYVEIRQPFSLLNQRQEWSGLHKTMERSTMQHMAGYTGSCYDHSQHVRRQIGPSHNLHKYGHNVFCLFVFHLEGYIRDKLSSACN